MSTGLHRAALVRFVRSWFSVHYKSRCALESLTRQDQANRHVWRLDYVADVANRIDSSPAKNVGGSKPHQFPGLPGWTRARCLGCDGVVKAARHPYVVIGGRRDGSGLLVIGAKADAVLAEELEALGNEPFHLFGVAHRACLPIARERLHRRNVDLPDALPLITTDEIDELPEEFHHPPTGRLCPLCGSEDKLTDEHVWPLWFSRVLRKHAGASQDVRPFTVSMHGRERRVRMIDLTAPICSLCNGRWLSVLEQDVRPILEPMILGEERVLSRDAQLLLATWAAKTVLMFDVASGEAVIPMGYYREFANLRAPLPSTRIWIGAYREHSSAFALREALWIDIPPDERPNAYATTITAFRVVFQVFGHFVKAASFHDRRYQFASAIHRIWPIAPGAIRWPPRNVAFGDESLRDFATSFEGRHPDAGTFAAEEARPSRNAS